MKLTHKEIIELVFTSLDESPEEWTYGTHYHTFKKGIGIPFNVKNKKIKIDIWIANGASMLNVKTIKAFDINNFSSNEERIIPVNYWKRLKIYYKVMKIIKENGSNEIDLDIDKKYVRDIRIGKIIK